MISSVTSPTTPRRRRERPLRSHLVTLVVIALLPAVVFSAVVVALLGSRERRWTERGLSDTARALASAVDREVNSSVAALRALGSSSTLSDGRLAEFHTIAERVRRSQPGWDSVFLMTPAGDQILNTAAAFGAPLPALGAHPFVADVRARGKPYVSGLVPGPVTDQPHTIVTVPVMHENHLRYIVGAAFRTDTLNALIAEQNLPGDWTGTLIDQSLTIIARSRSPERYVGQPITAGLAGHLRREYEGSFYDTTKDGVPSFGVFSRTRLGNWIVVLALPASALTSVANRSLATMAVGGIVCIALGVGAAIVVARRIARPVAELTAVAEAVGGDTVPDRVPPSGVAEITHVGEALHAAAALLQERSKQREASERALREQSVALETINQVGPMLSAELDLSRLVQALTDAATRLTGAAFGAFFYNVMNQKGESYLLYALSGVEREAFENFPMPRNTAVFGPTFAGRGPIRLDDVRADPRYGQNPPYHGMPTGHLPVRSYLAVPVVSRSGEVFGGLFFGHPEPGRFTERHEQIALGLAGQAAVAMDNARLYERTERARSEAEAASRSKDEFLATLSHELRTPLNAVLGWTVMLRENQLDPSTTTRALDAIFRNARAQAQLIEDLLDTSRIISGKLRLNVSTVDLLPVVEAALDAVQPAAAAREIQLGKALDPDAGCVAGDPDRLQQIVWNLLSNAIKFTPRGGRVDVRLQRVNSHVEVVIADTGRGISPEMLSVIFERFRQHDSSSTREHGGLGIGLALVKHLVELHGGSVIAESPGEGAGATFTVRMPVMTTDDVDAPRAEVLPSPAHSSIRLAGIRVLVVDDRKETLEIFTQLFRQQGAEVQSADNVPDALEIFVESRPDVLVSDIEMPGEDGYSLIRKIRARPPEDGGRLPAIAVTAYASVEHRIRALSAGFDAYVAKPVDPAELLAVMASLAARL